MDSEAPLGGLQAGAIILTAQRQLQLLEKVHPERSGPLRLELCRARNALGSGRLSAQAFTAAVGDILLASAGPRSLRSVSVERTVPSGHM